MPEVVIPVSVANMKALEKRMARFARELRNGNLEARVEQAVAGDVATIVRAQIASVQDVDGNYMGTDNPNASVQVRTFGLPGHSVVWQGRQIAYVEFGTGEVGASALYPNVGAMAGGGYFPDPTHKHWVYKDAKTGKWTRSHGLDAQAPMWLASQLMRLVDVYASARAVLGKAARDAVTL